MRRTVTAGRWGGLVLGAVLLALQGCAVDPAAPVRAEAAQGAEVTALASAPDSTGQRTWWLFFDGHGVAVQARDVEEALGRAGVTRGRNLRLDATVSDRAPDDITGEGPSWSSSMRGTSSVGIGGGGR
jgi:hypothetical protein